MTELPITNELKRLSRVSDFMASAHSVLRERYHKKALTLDLVVLVSSGLLTAVTLVDLDLVATLGIDEIRWRLLAGLLAMLIFLISIVGLRVTFRESAAQHQQAVRALVEIKKRANDLLRCSEEIQQSEGVEFARLSSQRMLELRPIPESQFETLKAKHRRKMAISRLLDKHPSTPVFLLRLKMIWQDSKRAIRVPPPE